MSEPYREIALDSNSPYPCYVCRRDGKKIQASVLRITPEKRDGFDGFHYTYRCPEHRNSESGGNPCRVCGSHRSRRPSRIRKHDWICKTCENARERDLGIRKRK